MTNRFVSPNQQFSDQTGAPYAGGFLYFYASGTDTPLNTYSDYTLLVANTNPVVLDSAGRAGSIFLQNLAYKVVLKDVNGVQIWTQDPVWSSEYSAYANVQPFAGSPNGLLAGTASTQGALPGSSMVWDYVNNVLYVCTTTGSAATAVWTAVNAVDPIPQIPVPAGYLTLTSGVPVIPTNVVAATAVIYTPFQGNTVPIYTGSTFTIQTFSELTLTLVAAHALNTIYDVFVFNNAGVLTLVTGPAWTNSTGGAGNRGTGAGTTELSLTSGIYVNAVSMTGRNGNTTYAINANVATYLGSIYMDSTAGQISCYRTFGQDRKWGVWNAYNQVPLLLQGGDSTANWTYNTSAIRSSNGSGSNRLITFTGLPTELIYCEFSQTFKSVNSISVAQILIGVNSTTAGTGKFGSGTTSTNNTTYFDTTAICILSPGIGINNVRCLEKGNGTDSVYLGGSDNMMITAQWRG